MASALAMDVLVLLCPKLASRLMVNALKLAVERSAPID